MAKKKPPVKKQRGGWLTAALVLMMIHGVFAAFLVLYLRELKDGVVSPVWVLLILFALAVAHIVAALAIWEWKRWGLILYTVTIVVSSVVGLILTHTQLWVFHEVLLLVILGYLVKDKMSAFD